MTDTRPSPPSPAVLAELDRIAAVRRDQRIAAALALPEAKDLALFAEYLALNARLDMDDIAARLRAGDGLHSMDFIRFLEQKTQKARAPAAMPTMQSQPAKPAVDALPPSRKPPAAPASRPVPVRAPARTARVAAIKPVAVAKSSEQIWDEVVAEQNARKFPNLPARR